MSNFGGMQLLPSFRANLDPRFLKWYLKEFTGDRMIYGHWPVACKWSDDPHYHRVITQSPDGRVKVNNNMICNKDMYEHTYRRNLNSCSVALGGFLGATTSDLGSQCATPEMIDKFVEAVAEICLNYRIPVSNFMSHGEAADNVDQGPNPPYDTPYEAYGPMSTWERWDLHVWIDPTSHQIVPPLGKKIPHNYVYFPDWVRGQAIQRIEDQTEKYWKV